MLDKLTGKPVHYYIQLVAMMGIAAGLPFSKIPLSIGTLLLGLNVILLWDWRTVWKRWSSNRWLWLLFTYFAIELLSVLWTSDKHEAWNMIRRELTLYAIPLTLIALPLNAFKHYKWVVLSFLTAVFITSFINVGTYFHWWGSKVYDDIRSLSLFVSHLRYAMMIVLALVFCASWWIRKFPYRWIAVALAAWFIYYTILSQIWMGVFTLSGIVLMMFWFKVKSIRRLWIKRSFIAAFSACILFVGIFLYIRLQPVPHKVEVSSSDYVRKTVNGNPYTFDVLSKMNWENGYPVQAFIADEELEKEWSKSSRVNYRTGVDLKGNPIRNILWRYMTSKGLRKDSLDFQKMSKRDIRNVEMGFASIEMAKGGISAQLYRMRSQLKDAEDPNGKSLLEKIESLKAGITIIKNHPFCGVGVGDMQQSFADAYRTNGSKLKIDEHILLTHNQFLTTWIAGGIICFLAFVGFWFIQLATALRINAFEWTGFLVITMLSFLIEDTLQTQTGVSFAAFFFAFFITGKAFLYPGRAVERTESGVEAKSTSRQI